MSTIPVVSFANFLTGDRARQKEVATQVYNAFSSVGFIYLRDHGIPQERVDEMFALVSRLLLLFRSGPPR
jgi:isopenicillin N synthase-like dioxygenase